MNFRSAARGFLALLSAQALWAEGDWRVSYSSSNVCALRGSAVNISCTYEYPDDVKYHPNTVHTLWFTKAQNHQPVDLLKDTDYRGGIDYSCREISCSESRCSGACSLSFSHLIQGDSGVYKFMFTTPQPGLEYTGEAGVNLTVTDLQVKFIPHSRDSTWTLLQCHSGCGVVRDPRYIWSRNGQKVQGEVNHWVSIRSEDHYSCAVEGYEHLRSPEVYAPKSPSVTASPSGGIAEGSSVTLSCSSDANPAASYSWFKVNTDGFSRNMNQGPQLNFGRIQPSDSGQYHCGASNNLGSKSESISINVKYAPKSPSVTASPSGGIAEGSSVTLSCSSDANPAAKYSWFKVNTDGSSSNMNQGPQLNLRRIQPSDSGQYRCEAKNNLGSTSESISINVKYAPKSPSVTASPSGEIAEGSSVTLSCSSDANPAASYSWFKEHQDLGQSGQTFIIANITSKLGGNYSCQAQNAIGRRNSTLWFIKVTSSSQKAIVAITSGVLLATIFLLVFLWMRRKRASRQGAPGQEGRPETKEEPLPLPTYGNISVVTNHVAPAAKEDPTEAQDEQNYGSIQISASMKQEVPLNLVGSSVQSDPADAVTYSVVSIKRPNTVPEGCKKKEIEEISVLYSTVKYNTERV